MSCIETSTQIVSTSTDLPVSCGSRSHSRAVAQFRKSGVTTSRTSRTPYRCHRAERCPQRAPAQMSTAATEEKISGAKQ